MKNKANKREANGGGMEFVDYEYDEFLKPRSGFDVPPVSKQKQKHGKWIGILIITAVLSLIAGTLIFANLDAIIGFFNSTFGF